MQSTVETGAGRGNPAPPVVRAALLACGIASALLYVAMNIIGAMQFSGYSLVSHTISELSAIGAPSRPTWVALGAVYNVLVIAFGLGVYCVAGSTRALRVVGALLVASGAIGFVWPPMHPRGEGFTLMDAMHIAVTAVALLLFLLIMGFGAAAFGKRFRIYSVGTILVFLVFGTLVGMDGPRVAANLPTPWAGLTERINFGAYLVWIVALAIRLMRRERAAASRRSAEATITRPAAA